jgi:anaerobic selenocysteine-containing dehydrogenase
MLRGPSGIQWPCTPSAPGGTERLYTDGRFNTDPATCESFGQDFVTGAAHSETEYRAKEPRGRAFLHAVEYQPPPETASDDDPFTLTTGRTVYHFHTRTKTGRSPELQAAAPNVWVEIHPDDASAIGIGDGDLVRIENGRGHVDAVARLAHGRRGEVFVPFHYGMANYGPPEEPQHASTAANELTLTSWDPVSRQPTFKIAAVHIRGLNDSATGNR